MERRRNEPFKLTESQVKLVEDLFSQGETMTAVAAKFGVAPSTLSKYVNNHSVLKHCKPHYKRVASIVITSEMKEFIIEAIAEGKNLTTIAGELGFSYTTLRTRMHADPELKPHIQSPGCKKHFLSPDELDKLRQLAPHCKIPEIAAIIGRKAEWLEKEIKENEEVNELYEQAKLLPLAESTLKLREHAFEKDDLKAQIYYENTRLNIIPYQGQKIEQKTIQITSEDIELFRKTMLTDDKIDEIQAILGGD